MNHLKSAHITLIVAIGHKLIIFFKQSEKLHIGKCYWDYYLIIRLIQIDIILR